MPLLNFDLDEAAELALPVHARELFRGLTVRMQLLGLAEFAKLGNDENLRRRALAALAVLERPGYISLWAARQTIRLCNACAYPSAEAQDVLVGVGSTPEPQPEGVMETVRWYRPPNEPAEDSE